MSDDDETPSRGWRASMRERVNDATDGMKPGVLTRIQYASYLFGALVVCLMMRSTLSVVIEHVPYLREGCTFAAAHAKETESPSGPTASPATLSETALAALSHACYENTVVYRISFALAIFYFIQFLLVSDVTCCVGDDARAKFQNSFFSVKSALLFLINCIVYWIPNSFFAAYAWVCMFVSAIFLVIQILLIVDFAYEWNEDWGDRGEENNKWTWYLAIVALGSYAAGIAFTVYNYINFTPHSDCNLNGFIITVCLLCAIIYTAVGIWVPHGSIVPCGIVFCYTSFLCYTALRLSSDARCNLQYTPPGGESLKSTIFMAIISGGALAYSVVSAGASSDSLTLEDGPDEDGDGNRTRRGNTLSGHLPGYCYFHLIMLMGAMYLAMLATDWRVTGAEKPVNPDSTVKDLTATNSAIAFWVKVSTQWLTIVMFLWSLLAPYFCCKHRDFGYDPVEW